jgi:hypothetical protein
MESPSTASTVSTVSTVSPPSLQRLQTLAANQDNQQKAKVAVSVTLELYRVLVSTLLILFVPQKCHDHVCTYQENMETESPVYTAGLALNFLTMAIFLTLYGVEIKRENRLITYLDVNKSKPADNESVGKALESLSVEKRESIWKLDAYYQVAFYAATIAFVANFILSGIVVYDYSLGNQTTTTMITNILFMAMKLTDVYGVANTDSNIFYSAYLKGNVQFNDVDPDKATDTTATTAAAVIELAAVNHDHPICVETM